MRLLCNAVLVHFALFIFFTINVYGSPQLGRRLSNQQQQQRHRQPTPAPDVIVEQRNIGGEGIGEIVTPEPNVTPTTRPQIIQSTSGNECVCVPYYLCDPMNNELRIVDQANDDDDDDVDDADDVDDTMKQPPVDGFGVIDIRFNPDTCQAALDVCCKMGEMKEEPIVPPAPPSRGGGCGIRNVGGLDFKLAGATNNEAGFGEFPWTVALIRISDDALICVGSLIHAKAVLTGNHCVIKYLADPSDIKVRAGEWDTQTTKERLPYQERLPSRIFSHPKYNERSLAYDVAIIELEDPFRLDDHINTVCLPPANAPATGQSCFATGWGKDVFGKEGKYSVIMKRIPLPIVPFDKCQEAMKKTKLTKRFQLDPSFICAGGIEGVDTCQGDGGGPLVCPVGPPEQNRYTQFGIVAWGIGCNEQRPAVYANVAMAREWIDSQIGYIGLDANYYRY